MKKNVLALFLSGIVSTPFFAGAEAVGGSCDRNMALAQTLSDNGGPYLAPICLGPPGSTDAPFDRATHAKNDVTRMSQCPPGVSGAVCFQRRGEVFAYACENGMLPQTVGIKMQKTPQGCEGDKPGVTPDKDAPQKSKNCPIFKVDAWRITCPAAPQLPPPVVSPAATAPSPDAGTTLSPDAGIAVPGPGPAPDAVVNP